jgi:uncharacterized protein YxjI
MPLNHRQGGTMDSALNRNLFFIKEHPGVFKAANNFDVLDPESKQVILECREENLGFFTKILRFTDYKRMTPFNIVVKRPDGRTVLRVARGVSIFLSKVDVLDENNQRIGGFKQKLFTIGGAFQVLDKLDRAVCTLQGKWTSWEFTFKEGTKELAKVTKKWAGIGKEMFTSADNYMLSVHESVAANAPVRPLILAAVLCIDMVLKE